MTERLKQRKMDEKRGTAFRPWGYIRVEKERKVELDVARQVIEGESWVWK